MSEPPRISVVIPALNEARTVDRAIVSALAGGAHEVVVADGGSDDGTAAVALRAGAEVVDASRGRGSQLNRGADAARGDVLLFLHADTTLPRDFAAHVERALDDADVVAGAFRFAVDRPSVALRLIAAGVNLRSTWRQLPYGDQGIFLRRATFVRLGGFAPIAAMEDVDLVRRLRRMGRIAIVQGVVTTSARRWRRHGALRTTLLNQVCLAAFGLGVDPARIAGWRNDRSGPGIVPYHGTFEEAP